MKTVKEIYDYIDSFAPFSIQCHWDNSGLLVGNINDNIYKIGFCLDITESVITQAVSNECNLIISHHPIIFDPLKQIDSDSLIAKLIKSNINVICTHTNLDKSIKGTNIALGNRLGLTNVTPLNLDEDTILFSGETEETGSVDFLKMISEKLDTCTAYKLSPKPIKKIVLCSGSGGEYIKKAAELGFDAYLTGEIKYHNFLEVENMEISVFCCGHFETEILGMKLILEEIQKKLNIDCILLKEEKMIRYYGVN